MRSTLPVDSVGSEFRRSFITLGQSGMNWKKFGDTVFVRAGPAPLPPRESPWDTTSYGASYWTRMVAFPKGDSTHFRLYVAIVAPARGWKKEADSVSAYRPIDLCARIGKTVGFRWIRRTGDPAEEESFPVWSRVP